MLDWCINCNEAIREFGLIKSSNYQYSKNKVNLVNAVHKTNYDALCENCGKGMVQETIASLSKEQSKHREYVEDNALHFPMMTLSQAPAQGKIQLINVVTANVACDNGLKEELSQGFSGFFGASGKKAEVILKTSPSESLARAIIARKTRVMGGNCVLAVNIEHVTGSAMEPSINMQGTAAYIGNLEDVLRPRAYAEAQALDHAFTRLDEIAELLTDCL